MGAQRNFLPVTIPAEAGRRRVHRITCAECHTTNEVSANTHCGSRAVEDLMRVWSRGGWTIGKNPSGDICPQCSSEKRRARRARNETTMPSAEVIHMTSARAVPPNAGVKIEPDKPVEMGRDDRRIIFAKLDEVYLSADQGYSKGWTDKRIAEDLGVPRAWVEGVREEMFGPARDNEDIRALRTELDGLRAALEPTERRCDALLTQAKTASLAVVELRERMDRLAKRLAEVEAHVIP